ncbi:MAG: hypothetical protein WA705_00220 [Candidatus Ozemobacteraceae bacterium]
MKWFLQKRFVVVLTLIVLGVFGTTLLETTRVHFFHDVLPENDNAFFTRFASRPYTPRLQTIVFSSPIGACPYNRLLSFLEASSHVPPVSPIWEIETQRTSRAGNSSPPVFEPVFSHQARAPPLA